ncbi:MAG TPA: H-X9-DG-CTERM domain-containing protein [Verrucomicrobiae bacterium]|nr:H-X9-DG-CTERM domain-containing protein [Verrucomicrobiae bacterium]
MKKGSGFSLLEVLIVISLIVIIAGMLLPALNRAREKARAAYCLQHLKQWGAGTHLFAAENDGRLPKDGFATPTLASHFASGWYVQLPEVMGLAPYIEMPWRTNASIEPPLSPWICAANARRSNGNLLFHYCLNSQVNGTAQQIRIFKIPNPAATVWLFDNGKIAAVAQQNNVHTNVHNGGAQILFLDGHVRRFPNAAYWDFKANKGRTDHPELLWRPNGD